MSSGKRGSLLTQAGDAFNQFRFGRRRPSIRQPVPQPVLAVPHVIDISAPPPDEEIEERQRLKDAAAQSIGLGPLLEPTEEEEEHKENEQEQEQQEQEQDEALIPLPPFPASPALLAPFATLADTLPKYYPPSSLRIFALAKQWKGRHLLLSLPIPPAARTRARTGPGVAHLHLFKGPAPDERELERLEINADSVVFVADDAAQPQPDVGHTGWHVVKVAGADVGALKRDWNPTDDAGRTVWLLHLASPADAQRWISAIKSAILEQRTHRAGLAPTLTPNNSSEPRGDMDVMLSLRLQASGSGSAPHTPRLGSAPPTNPNPQTQTHSQPPTPTTPTHPHARPVTTHGHPNTAGYAASLAPSTSAASNYANSESRSVRSVATAPAPSNSSSFLPGSASFSNPFARSPSGSASENKHKREHKSRSASSSTTTTVRSNPGTISQSAGMGGGERGGRPTTAVAALKGLFSAYGGAGSGASSASAGLHTTTATATANRPRSSSAASFVSVGSRASRTSFAPASSVLGIGRASHSAAHGHPGRATSLSGPAHPASASSAHGHARAQGFPYRANVRASSASADELVPSSSSFATLSGSSASAGTTGNPNGAESFGRMGALLGNIHANGVGGGVAPRARPSTGPGGGSGRNTSTNTLPVGVGGLERRIVGQREDLAAASSSHPSHPSTTAAADAEDEGQELIAPKRRTLSSLGLPFGLGGSGTGTPLQPPPRRKRWTGGSFSSATSNGNSTGATGSKWEKEKRRDRAISEDGHAASSSYSNGNGNGNGYPTQARTNGRPGSAGSHPGSVHRPGSSNGTMYAHPHANGSSGTAGSFGVRSTSGAGGGGGGSYAGSVRTFEER
ncbi:hypothetical protein C8F04DRAFT_1389397, partial [Mycena alexandri]